MQTTENAVSTAVLSLDGDWLLATDPQNVETEQQWWTGPTPGAKQTAPFGAGEWRGDLAAAVSGVGRVMRKWR